MNPAVQYFVILIVSQNCENLLKTSDRISNEQMYKVNKHKVNRENDFKPTTTTNILIL